MKKLLFWTAKAMGGLVVSLIALIALEFVTEMFFPAGFATSAGQHAYALIYRDCPYKELPNEVEITIDGTRAHFQKGSKSFDQLVTLLQDGHSQAAFASAGARPEFPGFHCVCGEMVIRSFGIPFHFRLIRSDVNKNYFWIGLTKLTSPGTAYPIFTVDPNIEKLVQANSR